MQRRILHITGPDGFDFLQGLVTNDLTKLDQGLVYAALLTPQGKYLSDFFLFRHQDGIALDVSADQADGLLQRLTMYKLRANLQIAELDLTAQRGTGPVPDGAMTDPRLPELGWRIYGADPVRDNTDWDALRVAHLVPEAGVELTPDSFILEMGFERLNGVDFRKGCYVGQEIAARMKHKTELRKGLAQVRVTGDARTGDEITAEGKPAGTLLTRSGDLALAYLRYDRATRDMQAGTATLTRTA